MQQNCHVQEESQRDPDELSEAVTDEHELSEEEIVLHNRIREIYE